MASDFNLRHKAAGDHEHMLGCGFTYFQQAYPAEWERVRSLPLEEGLAAMIAFYKAEMAS